MNFDYLKNIEELQNLYIAVSSDNQTDSAYLRCIKYGRCLESLVRYTYAKHFPKYKAASSELIKLLKDKTFKQFLGKTEYYNNCLLYTSPSPRDKSRSRMPSSA